MGITMPAGFRASGVVAGIRSDGRKDLAVVVNEGPTQASAAVFTSNRAAAAPVIVTREYLSKGTVTAVVLNSGGANACTGSAGIQDAREISKYAAKTLGIDCQQVGVCSTGLIGERLPLSKIFHGIDDAAAALAPTAQAGTDAAQAIRTTDTVDKQAYIARGKWSIGGMAKGAGMLAPGLATMLCVITTDAVIADSDAKHALEKAVHTTFNRTDSDGCMSTNDSVILLASGSSGISVDTADFSDAVEKICANLARQLIADAEGATHDIAITVTQASDERAAEVVARAIARSNLVKTAIFGADPNWGRIVSEVGAVPESLAPYDPSMIDVFINGVEVCHGCQEGESRGLVSMEDRDVHILVDLHAGDSEVTVWTNDLTYDYVHENSAYSS